MIINIPMIGLTAHGGNRVLIQLANFFVENGCSVNIYYPAGLKDCIPYKINSGVQIKPLGFDCKNRYLTICLFFMLFFFKMINKKSIIFANQFLTFYPAFICSFFNNKYYYFVQGIESEIFAAKKNPLWKIGSFLCNLTYKSKKIISANKYLETRLFSLNSSVIYQFNLGVDDVFFEVAHQESIKVYDFVYFPRQEAHKGLYRFYRLLENEHIIDMRPKILLIGQNFDFLHDVPQGVELVKVSPKSDEEMIQFLDQSKCLLLTSVHEGFSLPPLEAMARGIPAIMFNCGGPNIYINEKNAIVVESQEEFVYQIDLFLRNQIDIFDSVSCKMTAAQYSMRDEMNKLLQFLKSNFNKNTEL